MFSHRYPTSEAKPDGASSSTVVAWTSADGGRTWTPQPAIVGRWNVEQLVAIGDDAKPTILNFGVDPLCTAPGPASGCLESLSPTLNNGTSGNLTTGTNQNYYANLTRDEHGLPASSVENLADTFVRRWTGIGSPQDPAMWTAPSVFPLDQGSMAGGPAGVFLMGKAKAGFGPYSVMRLNAGAGGAYVAARGSAISPASDDILGRLFQDPSGRLIAAWEQRDTGLTLRTTNCRAAATPTFTPKTTLSTGADNGQLALGAAADGGGFVVFNHTGGVNAEGRIAAAALGTKALTGSPGIGNLAGGGVRTGLSLPDPQHGQVVRGTVAGIPGCATVRVDVLNAAGRAPA